MLAFTVPLLRAYIYVTFPHESDAYQQGLLVVSLVQRRKEHNRLLTEEEQHKHHSYHQAAVASQLLDTGKLA